MIGQAMSDRTRDIPQTTGKPRRWREPGSVVAFREPSVAVDSYKTNHPSQEIVTFLL
jgi:hypothetical protein